MTKLNHINNTFKKLDKATFDYDGLTHGYKLDEQKSIEHFGRVLHHLEFLIAINSCINGYIQDEDLQNLNFQIANFLKIESPEFGVCEEEQKAIDEYLEVTLRKLKLESKYFCLSFNLGLCLN